MGGTASSRRTRARQRLGKSVYLVELDDVGIAEVPVDANLIGANQADDRSDVMEIKFHCHHAGAILAGGSYASLRAELKWFIGRIDDSKRNRNPDGTLPRAPPTRPA